MSVLVFADASEGKYKKSAFEVVSYGKKVAEQLGTSLVVLSMNADSPSDLYTYGAERVLNVSNDSLKNFNAKAYASVINQAVEKESATVVIVDSSVNGLYMAPMWLLCQVLPVLLH
jgi:electron transfer flavoprotein alpha subunit